MKRNALVFSPSLDGHRQVHAQYFFESLLRQNYQVFLVSESCEVEKNIPYLQTYHSNPDVKIIGINKPLEISLRDFRKLQDKLDVDLTVFLEADNQLKLINYQLLPGLPRLRGKNIGLFIRTSNIIYFQKPPSSLRNSLRFMKRLPKTWHSNPSIFHDYTLPKYKLLNMALMLDESFVEKHPKLHHWLPELVFPLLPDDANIAMTEQQFWEPRLASFLERNRGKEILLYFGEAQRRRGYDLLLKLACEEDCCFIHCGLSSYAQDYNYDFSELKKNLDDRGLLFETKAFIQSYQAIQLFFTACNYVVLPYEQHFGSSGVMMQAIHFGKPVLVSDLGLMAARAQKHHLGLTFSHDNYEDLKRQFLVLKETSNHFLNDLAQYKQTFSTQKVIAALDNILQQVIE